MKLLSSAFLVLPIAIRTTIALAQEAAEPHPQESPQANLAQRVFKIE